jgi:hypothetical protein
MPRSSANSTLLLLPLLGACSFLLDFDELQGGPPMATPATDSGTGVNTDASNEAGVSGGGTDGQASTGGAAGTPPLDSGPPCPESCDDGDPCTDDRCVNGSCEAVAAARIIEDDFQQTITGLDLYRASLVPGTDQFYLAAYGNFATGQDIRLYRFASNGDEWVEGPLMTDVVGAGADVPISPAALVFGSDDNLYAYFALGPVAPVNFLNAGQVQRVVLNATLEASTLDPVSADQNYRYINNTLGPAAAQLPGGDVYVAWAGAPPPGTALAAGIYLQSGTAALATAATPDLWEPAELRGLATIYGLGNETDLGVKGALWQAQRSNTNQVDTHMQLLGGLRQTFGQCVNNGVQGVSASTSRAHLDGFWFTTWTKQRDTSFVTEATSILCLTPGLCAFNATCGDAQSQLDDVRNPKIATYHRLSDANTVAHQALTASQIDVDNDRTDINLLVQRLSLEDPEAGLTSSEVGTLRVAQGPASNGPNWPEVAVIAPDKVAVTWIEYGANEDTLHVSRYRVCYGD